MTVDERLRRAATDLLADVHGTVDPEPALEQVVGRPPRRPPWLAAAGLVVVLGLAAVVVVATADDAGEPVTSGLTTESSAPPTTLAGPAPGESEGVAVTATPARDLADGDTVRVTVEGLDDDPNAQVELALCTGDAMDRAPDPGACEFPTRADPIPIQGGRAEGDVVVDRILNPGSGDDPVDCAPGTVRCAVGVTVNRGVPEGSPEEPLGPQLVGIVGVAFAPVDDRGEPVQVAPAEGLDHGQVVTVSGEGFVGDVQGTEICGSVPGGEEPACASASPEGVESAYAEIPVDARGAFSFAARVWRAIPTLVDERRQVIDCAEVACTLQVFGEDGTRSPPVPLRFTAATPTPAVPTLAVDPATGLRPGDPVTVTVRGLGEGEEAYLTACILGARGCEQGTSIESVVGESDGEVSVTLPAVDPAQYGRDCTEPGVCGVGLSGLIGGGDPLIDVSEPVPVQFTP